MRRLLVLALLLPIIAACATPVTNVPVADKAAYEREKQIQEELVLQDRIERTRRLDNISWPIMTHNLDLCPKHAGSALGLLIWSTSSLSKTSKEAAIRRFNLDERPHLLVITENGPAQRAGLKEGDILVSIDGKSIPEGKKSLDKAEEMLNTAARTGPFDILFKRGETLMRTTLAPQRACNIPVIAINDNIINAMATGKKIIITSGLMRFADDDRDLALIIGHEMAHNVMGHIDKKRMNTGIAVAFGLALDIFAASQGVDTRGDFINKTANIGAMAYSREFEFEADYVGLYIMARAGYDPVGAAGLWRRMVTCSPGSIHYATSHPTSPDRYLALENAAAEIMDKRAKGQDLLPEMKEE